MSADHPSNRLKGQSRCLIEQVLGHEFKVLHASFDIGVVVGIFILVHSYGPSGSYCSLALLLLSLQLSESSLDFREARAGVRIMLGGSADGTVLLTLGDVGLCFGRRRGSAGGRGSILLGLVHFVATILFEVEVPLAGIGKAPRARFFHS